MDDAAFFLFVLPRDAMVSRFQARELQIQLTPLPISSLLNYSSSSYTQYHYAGILRHAE